MYLFLATSLHSLNTLFYRSDIFVFLLSTRAGGLGINLTAADTVTSVTIPTSNHSNVPCR